MLNYLSGLSFLKYKANTAETMAFVQIPASVPTILLDMLVGGVTE